MKKSVRIPLELLLALCKDAQWKTEISKDGSQIRVFNRFNGGDFEIGKSLL